MARPVEVAHLIVINGTDDHKIGLYMQPADIWPVERDFVIDHNIIPGFP